MEKSFEARRRKPETSKTDLEPPIGGVVTVWALDRIEKAQIIGRSVEATVNVFLHNIVICTKLILLIEC